MLARRSKNATDPTARLARAAQRSYDECLPEVQQRVVSPLVPAERLRATAAALTGQELEPAEFVDQLAQTVACCRVAWSVFPDSPEKKGARDWLVNVDDPFWRPIFCLCFPADPRPEAELLAGPLLEGRGERESAGGSTADCWPLIAFYEQFLHRHDAGRRQRRGLFTTPREVVSFIIRSLDEMVTRQWQLAEGLADASSWASVASREGVSIPSAAAPQDRFLRLLDPAVGTGAFLVDLVQQVHGTMRRVWTQAGLSAEQAAARWQSYVHQQLLPSVYGFEILLPAAALARMNLALQLVRSGYCFQPSDRLHVYLTNTLLGPTGPGELLACPQSVAATRHARMATAFTVILGNPPFSGISANRGRWIDDLLKGRWGGQQAASYYECEGQPLRERKLWLQDDYVKFLRYAQWRIEASGCGLIGLITNHGYLDNATFRGLREKMLRALPHLTVIDLHGSIKKREARGTGRHDRNVFAIEQGVAVGLFCRPGGAAPLVGRYGELWGEREQKLSRLSGCTASQLAVRSLDPQPPHYLLVPQDQQPHREYEPGWTVPEVFPTGSTAPVTARDHLVVAFDRAELIERLSLLRDLGIPDAEIRRRFFPRPRSARYPPGDTRGWQLAAARQLLAADPDWMRHIVRCLYRPFDYRWIYWHPAMIDWPRREVTRHLTPGGNLALIVRRQMLPGHPCTYFWLADGILLDGVVRSDNRGSESFFPLLLQDGPSRPGPLLDLPQQPVLPATRAQPNLSPQFLGQLERRLGLTLVPRPRGDLQQTIGVEDVLALVYAQFHSQVYRRRYADLLRAGFPRIFVPRHRGLARLLCEAGTSLLGCHLIRPDEDDADTTPATGEAAETTLAPLGLPHYDPRKQCIEITDTACVAGVPPEVWEFHVGGHQVCRKWLQDRRGELLTTRDLDYYRRIVAAVATTLALMQAIDRVIAQFGGWPAAFAGRETCTGR